MWLYPLHTSRRKWTSLAAGFSLLAPPGFLAEQFTKSFSRATGTLLAVVFEEQDQNSNRWTCWIPKQFITSFMTFRYGFTYLKLNMCSIRNCLLIKKVCAWLWEVVLESCDLWSHHNTECMTWSGTWCWGQRSPSMLGRCSIPELLTPPCPAHPCREAWLVFMQCFPCDTCHEVLGCYLGTGEVGNGNISALMLRKHGQNNFSNLFAIIREKLEENEDFVTLPSDFSFGSL